jgi:hypothetical protein
VFNYQNTSNYYYVSFNEQNDHLTHGIFKIEGGAKTQLVDLDGQISGGTTYQIKIVKSGATIIVSRNDSQVGTVTDSTFDGGKIGVAGFNDDCYFDNLMVVTDACGPPPTPTPIPVPTPTPTLIETGDINGDGLINIFDVQLLINCILGDGSCDSCDLNSDGLYNIFDLQLVINLILGEY